jgi:hypothetical protein
VLGAHIVVVEVARFIDGEFDHQLSMRCGGEFSI